MIGIDSIRRAGAAREAAEGVDGGLVHILSVVEMCIFERSRR